MTPAPNPERRNERSRRATLDATIELTTTRGYAKVSVDAIATHAGVSKQTIYRWWPSRAVLTLEALADHIGDATAFPDTGDITADLTTQLERVVAVLTSPIGDVLRGIIADAQTDPAVGAALRESLIEPPTRLCQARLEAAIADGQLRNDVPTSAMVEMIYGTMYYRLLLGTATLGLDDVPLFIARTLDGLRPRSVADSAHRPQ
ncbi:TetR/AcrR family transcriptional regulator [Streptomyces sp. MZ04]|uniref:TetR/AcrR family transcriptional regulator n=1 Tax=Streptomyces sp. MZ04 TaxID=2559236 RepID=UPI001433020B|nr:TetR/AcrR family transcriptional regulator [Streptomyces sp. MZ04]